MIKGIIILDNDGNRLLSKVSSLCGENQFLLIDFLFKYYNQSFPTVKEQKEFEKSLFNKTHKGSGDVILLDNWTIVYRNNVDLLFYVMGSTNENEVKRCTNDPGKCLFNSFSADAQRRVDLSVRRLEHDVTKECRKTASLRQLGFGHVNLRRNV